MRFAILATSLLLVGCASAPSRAVDAVDSSVAFDVPAPSAELTPAPDSAVAGEGVVPFEALEIGASREYAASPAPVPQEESLHSSRFTIKAGYYGAEEDELDDGYILGVSWMRFFSRLLAIEFELGYVDADGEGDGEVWSLPIMLNGRLNLPIWILEAYGGLGVGGFYYDAEGGGENDDGFLWGGNAFLGASVNLADAIALGLEGKYYVSDDISDDLDFGLDAFALMLTLGFSR